MNQKIVEQLAGLADTMKALVHPCQATWSVMHEDGFGYTLRLTWYCNDRKFGAGRVLSEAEVRSVSNLNLYATDAIRQCIDSSGYDQNMRSKSI